MDRGTFVCDICKSVRVSNVDSIENDTSNTPSCSSADNVGENANHVENYSQLDNSNAQTDDVILIDSDDDEVSFIYFFFFSFQT